MLQAEPDPAPTPPTQPGESECCESGCDNCVWTVYAANRTRYEREYADWLLRHSEALHDDAFWGGT